MNEVIDPIMLVLQFCIQAILELMRFRSVVTAVGYSSRTGVIVCRMSFDAPFDLIVINVVWDRAIRSCEPLNSTDKVLLIAHSGTDL